MTNSTYLDQLASEANWSGSTLFAKIGHVVLNTKRVKGKDHSGSEYSLLNITEDTQEMLQSRKKWQNKSYIWKKVREKSSECHNHKPQKR